MYHFKCVCNIFLGDKIVQNKWIKHFNSRSQKKLQSKPKGKRRENHTAPLRES